MITYQPLDSESFAAIVDHEVEWLQRHVMSRLGSQAFAVDVPFVARQWLMERGTSLEYGARELKRMVHRHLTQPLATMVTRGQIEAGSSVRIGVRPDRQSLTLRVGKESDARISAHPTVVVAEGNRELGQFLERLMSDAGWDVIVAGTAAEARRLVAKRKPHAVFAEAELPDDRGVALLTQLCRAYPELRGIVMTDGALPMHENAARMVSGVMILAKPFVARDANILVRSRPLSETFGRFDDSPKAA